MLRVAEIKFGADFLLRATYFAAAPILVIVAAELFPVTFAVLQVALALAVFLLGEAAHRVLGQRRWLRILLSNELRFEAHYRQHPPRPFLYYVFYPFLFPYWLGNRAARREFLLYKGYTWPAFVLLLVSLLVQYLRVCPPELTLRDFLPIAAGSLLAETVVVLMFLMPVVTSVVHFHHRRAPRTLLVLLLVGAVSIGYAVVRLESRRAPIVSFATRTRVRLRTEAAPDKAVQVQTRALEQALTTLTQLRARETSGRSLHEHLPPDGGLTTEAVDVARDTLATFYKADEAHAFELWLTRAPSPLLTVFFPSHRGHRPIWLSIDEAGRIQHDPATLSLRARRAFGLPAS
ncbi:MAG: hypothetical protein RLZZ450_7542 [Pseudomonadota bacterium]